ncbi:hypothetical protein FHR32_005101 [Streptosporangium album]|uniref:Uncharacterized protein n=1 Tax=Streptosporangium album TaxID=47479 RepID=A0A7W7WBZ4_9ACTN|nr:hypothetical protein [Streptosporangium album]MBB4940724.1 hypothetical protein [Streptosporangium album]
MSHKPTLPTRMHDPFPRIDIDEAGAFAEVLSLAIAAANRWTFGPDGPYRQPGQTMADIARGQIREALLHLLELGFVDVDEERMKAAPGWPMDRMSSRPTDLPEEA